MLILNLNKKPEWLDLGHGVRFLVSPITSEVMMSSRNDPTVKDMGEDASVDEMALVASKVLAQKVVLDWEGVGDEDGNHVEISKEGLSALLDLWPIFEAFQAKCVAVGLLVGEEKNVSAPLLNGATTGEMNIVEGAEAPAMNAQI